MAVQHGYGDGSTPGPGPPLEALDMSYGRLTQTEARMFRLLPVNPGPDISTAAAAALMDVPVSEACRMLADLAQLHLVKAVLGTEKRWQLHGLARRYADQLSDAHAGVDRREQARDQLLDYYLDMAEAADDQLRTLPGMTASEGFTGREDALAWLDAERANLTAAIRMASDTGRDKVAISLPLLLAQYLARQRRFDELLAATTIGMSAAQCLGDRYQEGNALTNLGLTLQELRRPEEAVTAHEAAVAIFRDIGDRRGQGDALNNLGLALKATRRLPEAITAHENAAAIFRDTADRHEEGNALNNLGAVLRESGRLEEAISTFQDAASAFIETDDRHGRGVALNNLGSALGEAGRFDKAIVSHQEAAAIFRESGDHHSEDIALENLEKAELARLA